MSLVKDVYTIIEKEGLEKNIWMKIGVAFVNRDNSLSIRLNAMPVNAQLHVRDRNPYQMDSKPRLVESPEIENEGEE